MHFKGTSELFGTFLEFLNFLKKCLKMVYSLLVKNLKNFENWKNCNFDEAITFSRKATFRRSDTHFVAL